VVYQERLSSMDLDHLYNGSFRFILYVANSKIGASCRGVKEQGLKRRGLEKRVRMSMQKRGL
jgi:hypothetical protein